MLTIADSILLLMEDEDGTFLPTQSDTVTSILAGAILIDLALADRVDTDHEKLIVLDDTPTGNGLMDAVLAEIVSVAEIFDTPHWIERLSSSQSIPINQLALDSLVQNGIVQRQDRTFLWHFHSRTFPTINFESKDSVKRRIRDVVLSDEIPHPADAAAACLVDACGLLSEVLCESAIKQRRSRMNILRKLDLIGREVIKRIAAIERKAIMAARAHTARLHKRGLVLSAIGGLAALATLLIPRVPIPNQFEPTLYERLWNDAFWQQWTGYLLLGLSLIGFGMIILLKRRLLTRWGNYSGWQFAHIGLGVSCVVVLFAHTGFRLGDNLNAMLMVCYLASLIFGALTGMLTGGLSYLRKWKISLTRKTRLMPVRIHIAVLFPLPMLLIAHILIVYLY